MEASFIYEHCKEETLFIGDFLTCPGLSVLLLLPWTHSTKKHCYVCPQNAKCERKLEEILKQS